MKDSLETRIFFLCFSLSSSFSFFKRIFYCTWNSVHSAFLIASGTHFISQLILNQNLWKKWWKIIGYILVIVIFLFSCFSSCISSHSFNTFYASSIFSYFFLFNVRLWNDWTHSLNRKWSRNKRNKGKIFGLVIFGWHERSSDGKTHQRVIMIDTMHYE